jgi:hypothetical protein
MITMAKITTMHKNNITDRSNHITREASITRDSRIHLRKPFIKNDLPKDNNLKCFPNKTVG